MAVMWVNIHLDFRGFFMMGGCCRLWSTTNHMCRCPTSYTP